MVESVAQCGDLVWAEAVDELSKCLSVERRVGVLALRGAPGGKQRGRARRDGRSHLETLLRQGGATLPSARRCACAPRTGRSGDASVQGSGRDGWAGPGVKWT